MSVFPELLAGRDDDFIATPWTIEEGSARRGGAACNLTERILRVPLGDDVVARTVRTHELLHARVSPHRAEHATLPFDVHPRAAECAEEFRVNTMLQRLHFDVAALYDGSEKVAGARVGEGHHWDEAVCFLLAVLGTGGEKPFLAGVRSQRPEWVAALRALAKRAEEIVARATVRELGATKLTTDAIPEGYARFTVPLARMVSGAMHGQPPTDSEGLRRFRRSLQPGGRRSPTGQFAPLLLATDEASQRRPRRMSLKRHRPHVSGTVVRYPHRFLSDPHVRIYGRRVGTRGGVVLVDQSGSMDVGEGQLRDLLAYAPGALVLGYSHRPGDLGQTPNAWVLADHTGVAVTPHTGNVGNGVDGPALRWALSLRRRGEPLVWVTDGQVTDSHDHPCDSLSVECALLVHRERVTMVRTLSAVPEGLRGRRGSLEDFGRVGRKLQEIAR